MNAMAIVENRLTSGLMTGEISSETMRIRKETWTSIKKPIRALKFLGLITCLNTRPPWLVRE
jgi:hypothetical protein